MLHAYQLLISIMSVKKKIYIISYKDKLPICLLLLSSVDFNIWKKLTSKVNSKLCFWKYKLWKDGRTPKLNITLTDKSSAKPPVLPGFQRALELSRGAHPQHSGV